MSKNEVLSSLGHYNLPKIPKLKPQKKTTKKDEIANPNEIIISDDLAAKEPRNESPQTHLRESMNSTQSLKITPREVNAIETIEI